MVQAAHAILAANRDRKRTAHFSLYSTNVDTGFAIRAIAPAAGELPGNKKRRSPKGKRRF
jgi:hypothetical protein